MAETADQGLLILPGPPDLDESRLTLIESLRARIAEVEAALASLQAERADVAGALKALPTAEEASAPRSALLQRQQELGFRCHHWINLKQVLLCRLYAAEDRTED